MTPLDKRAELILRELVKHIKRGEVRAGNPETYSQYGWIHDALGLELHGETVGQSLTNQGLRQLAQWTKANMLPAVTGLVVKDVYFEAGGDFFALYDRKPTDFDWWRGEVELALREDWERFLPEESVQQESVRPIAADIAPPGRNEITIYRILRDSAVARRVKRLHEHRCQFCEYRIELPSGQFYAEAHHIQPLGNDYCGYDVEENVLCLCPNHHAQMDYGVLRLRLEDLRQAPGHVVGQEYVDFHNRVIYQSAVV